MGACLSSVIYQKNRREEKNSSCVFLVALIKQMSDFEEVSNSVMRRRIACEKWKRTHREYYLDQKRRLANRPEYKAHRRAMYKERCDELKLLGILPRPKGRPRMYVGPEALEMKRQRAREAAARYRACQLFSQRIQKDESTTTSAPECESSDRCSDCRGDTAQSS